MTDVPICPHCQHLERDAWDVNFGEGLDGDAEIACGSCGEEYFCQRIVYVRYKTVLLKAVPGGKK